MSVSKILIGLGVLLILVGIMVGLAGKFPVLGKLGRLPGDIAIERENFRFYFPLTTSLLLSALLTVLFFLIGRFKS